MPIDPTRFLALTAMLAGACTRPAEAVAPDPKAAERAERAAMGRSLPEDATESADWGRGDAEEQNPMDSDGGIGTCDDAQANPGDCNAIELPRGPHCEGAASLVRECELLKTQFRPSVAKHFVDCLLAKNGTRQLCGSRGIPDCESRAVARACVPPLVRQQCEDVLSACRTHGLPNPSAEGYVGPPMTAETCQQSLAAMQPEYTRYLTECMGAACSDEHARFCRYRLRYVPRARNANRPP